MQIWTFLTVTPLSWLITKIVIPLKQMSKLEGGGNTFLLEASIDFSLTPELIQIYHMETVELA